MRANMTDYETNTIPLSEQQRLAYRVTIPPEFIRVESIPATSQCLITDSRNNQIAPYACIRMEEDYFPVKWQDGSWCIYSGENTIKPPLRVILNEDGQWQRYHAPNLPGGGTKKPKENTLNYNKYNAMSHEQITAELNRLQQQDQNKETAALKAAELKAAKERISNDPNKDPDTKKAEIIALNNASRTTTNEIKKNIETLKTWNSYWVDKKIADQAEMDAASKSDKQTRISAEQHALYGSAEIKDGGIDGAHLAYKFYEHLEANKNAADKASVHENIRKSQHNNIPGVSNIEYQLPQGNPQYNEKSSKEKRFVYNKDGTIKFGNTKYTKTVYDPTAENAPFNEYVYKIIGRSAMRQLLTEEVPPKGAFHTVKDVIYTNLHISVIFSRKEGVVQPASFYIDSTAGQQKSRKPVNDKFDFTGANLSYSDFSEWDTDQGHYKQVTELRGANFTGATMAGGDFTNIDFTGADFSDAILVRINNEGSLVVPVFRGARFQGATFGRHVNILGLSGADLRGADFKNSDLYIGIKDLTPAVLDVMLNHSANNNRSLMLTINSLDDITRKKELMAQLVDLVSSKDINLQPFLNNFNVLFQEDYLDPATGQFKNDKIQEFFTDKLMPEIAASTSAAPWKISGSNASALCNALLEAVKKKTKADFNQFVVEKNGFFIQLIHQSRNTGDESLKTRAEQLYARYLEVPDIKKYTANNSTDSGAQTAGRQSYILVSDTAAGKKALLLPEERLAGMLSGSQQSQEKWEQDIILHDQDGNEIRPTTSQFEQLFKEGHFSILAASFYSWHAQNRPDDHKKPWDLYFPQKKSRCRTGSSDKARGSNRRRKSAIP